MRIPLNFLCNGRRGIWVEIEHLPSETWQKLSASLVKTRLPGCHSVIYIASASSWSTLVTYGDTVCRTRAARRILTGQMLNVVEPTITGVLNAIAEDEQKLMAVPFNPPQRERRQINSMAAAAQLNH